MKNKNIIKIGITIVLFLAIISTSLSNKLNSISLLKSSQMTAQAASPTNSTVFEVKGTKIYKNGQEFVVKGTNMFSSQQAGELDKISNCWGFNTIRVPVFLKGGYQQAHPSYDNYDNITNIINAYTQAGIVVIFEAHDKCRYGFLAKLSSRLN